MKYVCMCCNKLIQEKESIRMPFTFEKVDYIYCRSCYNKWVEMDKTKNAEGEKEIMDITAYQLCLSLLILVSLILGLLDERFFYTFLGLAIALILSVLVREKKK